MGKREPININANSIKKLRAAVRSGAENRRGFYLKEAASNSQVIVRVSDESISLYVERDGRKAPLGVRYLVAGDEPILKKDIDKALMKGLKPSAGSKSRREKLKEAAQKKYARRTFNEWYDEYVALVDFNKNIRRFKSRQSAITNYFLKKPLPEDLRSPQRRVFGHITPGDLDAATANDWQRAIIKKHGKHAARAVKSYLSSMFTYLKRHRPEYLEIDGMPPLAPIHFEPHEKVRVNPLSDEQLKLIWDATAKLNPVQKNFVRFMMLTARRRGETEKLEWSDVDFDGGIIRFRSQTTKSKRPYVMPLTPCVREILETTPRIDGQTFVFPAPRAGSHKNGELMPHIDHIINGKPYVRAEFEAAGLTYKQPPRSRDCRPFDWRFHDFRDTAADILQTRIGLDFILSDQDVILGHDLSEGKGQRRAYNNFEMMPRKRVLFPRLENYIMGVVEPERAANKKRDTALPAELAQVLNHLGSDEIEAAIAKLSELRDKQNAQT